jgi:hypothetical protein
MNIKELDERIKQLKDLVASANDTIKLAEEMVGLAEKEMDKLADRKKGEPKFERVEFGHGYHYVAFYSGGLKVCKESEDHTNTDNGFYINNNYFHTKERAQEVADKINLLLKLERMYDTFCPDFVPDWNNYNERKYVVNVVYKGKGYSNKGELVASHTIGTKNFAEVYFPTLEIAQKVCDILNAEERSKDV